MIILNGMFIAEPHMPGNAGFRWALSHLPGYEYTNGIISTSGKRLRIVQQACPGACPDDYALSYKGKEVLLAANSYCGVLYGILETASVLRGKALANSTQTFPFKTRNYKYELRFHTGMDRKPFYEYPQAFWESFFQELTKRCFNGVVFYGKEHPFEFLLDYRGFSKARNHPLEVLERNRAAFNRILETATQYGIRTFLQNYVTHFTESLAMRSNLPFYKENGGRLAGLLNDELVAYGAYCYSALFEQCPGLSGLYMNYESAPNGYEFIEKAVLPVLNKMRRKPVIVHRLWNATVPERVRDLRDAYAGETILAHKIMDTSDTYYLPCADSRVREWKRHMGATEFMFIMGPCHNSGTNIDDLLWSDPQFVYTLLGDAKAKGADSISFHCVADLLSSYTRSQGIYGELMQALGYANYVHLQAVAEFFKNPTFSNARFLSLYREHFKVSKRNAGLISRAFRHSSSIVPLIYQQFHNTSDHEGFQIKGRKNYIQEPFFYYPCSFLNGLHKKDPNVRSSWMNKNKPATVCRNVYQFIIDYVNPEQRPSAMNPGNIAQLLRRHAHSSVSVLRRYLRQSNNTAFAPVLWLAEVNHDIGMWIAEEILAGIHFYRCYYAKSKRGFFADIERGMNHLKKSSVYLLDTDGRKERLKRNGGHMNGATSYDIKAYIRTLSNVFKELRAADIPFAAFKEFVRSRLQFSGIQRFMRPNQIHGKATLQKAHAMLRSAYGRAQASLSLLPEGERAGRYGSAVRAWQEYLLYELERIGGKSITCLVNGSSRNDEIQYLGLDGCFGYGDNFYEDFHSFIRTPDYFLIDTIGFSLHANNTALALRVFQRNCPVDGLEKTWDAIKGTTAETWFLQVYMDTENKGKRATRLTIAPRGRYLLKSICESCGRQYIMNGISRPVEQFAARYQRESVNSWSLDIAIPYTLLGTVQPPAGTTWGLQVVSNTCAGARRNYIWRPQYETNGNIAMMGRMLFKNS